MSDRCLASSGALAIAIAVGLLAPVLIAGQTSAPRSGAAKPTTTRPWTPPRTLTASRTWRESG